MSFDLQTSLPTPLLVVQRILTLLDSLPAIHQFEGTLYEARAGRTEVPIVSGHHLFRSQGVGRLSSPLGKNLEKRI